MRWRGKSFLPEKQNVFNTKRFWNRGFTSLGYLHNNLISYWDYLTPTSAHCRETKMLLCSFKSTKLTKAQPRRTNCSLQHSNPKRRAFLGRFLFYWPTPDGFRVEVIPTFCLGRDLWRFFTAAHPQDLLGKITILKHSCGNYVQNQLKNIVMIFFSK